MDKVEPARVIGMEACTGAHHWTCELQSRGYEVRLIAPQALLALRKAIPCWLADADIGLTDQFRTFLHGLWGDLVALEDRMTELDDAIRTIADNNEVTQRLLGISKRGDTYLRTLLSHGA